MSSKLLWILVLFSFYSSFIVDAGAARVISGSMALRVLWPLDACKVVMPRTSCLAPAYRRNSSVVSMGPGARHLSRIFSKTEKKIFVMLKAVARMIVNGIVRSID